tara:strand:+ start:5146 stop:5256 length:111 start_codon:yes stop_codon:yes gene_type:complete
MEAMNGKNDGEVGAFDWNVRLRCENDGGADLRFDAS